MDSHLKSNKMTSAIEKITLNTATFNEDVIEPSFINFFYGRNGTGKSTIARAIDLNKGVKWQDGKTADDFDVLVFGQDFINKNFNNYGNLPGVFTVCEINIEIQKQLDQKTADKAKLEEESTTYMASASAKSAKKAAAHIMFQDACWDKTKNIQSAFKEAMKGYGRKAQFLEKVLAISSAVEHDLTELKRIYDLAFDTTAMTYPEFSRAGSSTTTYGKLPGKDLMDKVIVSSSDTPFAKFIKALNASDWVRKGYEKFHNTLDKKCPYCQQPLPRTFEEDIASCFDAQYQQDINDLDIFKTTYSREMGTVLDKLRSNLNDVMPTIEKSLLNDYNDKLFLLEKNIVINNQRIINKVKEPTSIVALEDTDSLLIDIGKLIDEINKQIKANNDVVRNKKAQKTICINQVWEHIAFMLSADIAAYKKNQADIQKEIDELTSKANNAKRDLRTLAGEIADLNKQVVNTKAAIDSINALLKDSGFQGFCLREKAEVQNTYEVIREDGSIAENLSEGERSFIAFLYFYHLVRGNQNREELKDKIVVIDDPVSSMDNGILFIVSALVREMIEICYNNTDNQNEKISGNYIKQIFILTHNVYFHNEITYHQVYRFNSVNFYIIRKNNNISSIKLCQRQNEKIPAEQENYNPVQNSYASLWNEFRELSSPIPLLNVIRQILEHYFLQLCGYDGTSLRKEILENNRKMFISELEGEKINMDKYNLASLMLQYINNPNGIGGGLTYVEYYDNAEQYKEVFKLIFKAMHQDQHYNMMMGTML
jgi:wobble nucleotide-excising tRNase